MPHLYLSADDTMRPSVEKLPAYLELSGVNLHFKPPDRQMATSEAVRLVLRSRPAGAQAVCLYHTPSPASARLSFCLAAALRQLPGMEEQVAVQGAAPSGALRPLGIPAVLAAFSGTDENRLLPEIAQDAVLRALSHALAAYFRQPELPMRLERPAVLCGVGCAFLRHRPSHSAPPLAAVSEGAPVSLLGSSGDWALVRSAGTVGFLPLERIRLV